MRTYAQKKAAKIARRSGQPLQKVLRDLGQRSRAARRREAKRGNWEADLSSSGPSPPKPGAPVDLYTSSDQEEEDVVPKKRRKKRQAGKENEAPEVSKSPVPPSSPEPQDQEQEQSDPQPTPEEVSQPPDATSTPHQECSRRLSFGAGEVNFFDTRDEQELSQLIQEDLTNPQDLTNDAEPLAAEISREPSEADSGLQLSHEGTPSFGSEELHVREEQSAQESSEEEDLTPLQKKTKKIAKDVVAACSRHNISHAGAEDLFNIVNTHLEVLSEIKKERGRLPCLKTMRRLVASTLPEPKIDLLLRHKSELDPTTESLREVLLTGQTVRPQKEYPAADWDLLYEITYHSVRNL